MEGIISSDENPFNKFKIKSAKTFRDKLTEEEINKLTTLALEPESREWHARNMFILSFYCAGIRFGDLLQLKWKNIQGDHLKYVMDKTSDPHTVLLTEEAKALLNLYRKPYSTSEMYIFPFLKNNVDYKDYDYLVSSISSANTIINKHLKLVTIKAGINKKVSFHISRHSFAYVALRKTGDLYGVSKSLNHKRINTTEIYLKDKDPDAADSLIKKVFSNNA
jgi:integrase